MEEDLILISQINDFVFCPISIYFHNLYYERNNMSFQRTDQTNGRAAHRTIDGLNYSGKKSVVSGMDVYCERLGLIGKIDILEVDKKTLIERKKKVKTIYDGYVFQLYAQYFALREMGYIVEQLKIHSVDDNKTYDVSLPESDDDMLKKFYNTIQNMREFDIVRFQQNNKEKCEHCIYEPACDRSLYV